MSDTIPSDPLPSGAGVPRGVMYRLGSVLLFLLVSALGFEVIPLLAAVLLKLQLAPDLFNTPEGLQYLRTWIFGSGTWIWLASVPGALGYFFTPPPQRLWLLTAPLYVPLLYGMCAIAYFSF